MYKIAILGCENSHADAFLNLILNGKDFSDSELSTKSAGIESGTLVNKKTDGMSERMSKRALKLRYRIDNVTSYFISLTAICAIFKIIKSRQLSTKYSIVKLFYICICLANNYRSE